MAAIVKDRLQFKRGDCYMLYVFICSVSFVMNNVYIVECNVNGYMIYMRFIRDIQYAYSAEVKYLITF